MKDQPGITAPLIGPKTIEQSGSSDPGPEQPARSGSSQTNCGFREVPATSATAPWMKWQFRQRLWLNGDRLTGNNNPSFGVLSKLI
ncbi:MAG: hypothetical protein R2806_23705 [Saprospiraceae bacterium]